MTRRPVECVASVLALATAGSGVALGQGRGPTAPDEGPIIVGEDRGRLKAFELHSFGAALDFYGRLREDRIDERGQPNATDKEQFYRGTLDLFTRSFIGHKNLLDLTADVKLGLDDEEVQSDTVGEERSDLTFTNLYNVSGLILAESDTPLTVYTRRDETNLEREFSGSVRNTTSETGAVLQWRSSFAPTTFRYFHREEHEDDQLDTYESDLTQDSASVHSDIRLDSDQRIEFDYTFDHIDETQGFGFSNSYDRHDSTLTHTISFGPERRHDLRSNFRFYDETGKFPNRTLRLDEQLTLRHTDRFETRYNLTAENREVGSIEQQLVLGSAEARHRLFESLTSSATAGGSYLALPDEDFTSTGYFATGTLDYTKKVPMGRLDAGTTLGFNVQDNSDRGGTLSVIDQTATFNDPFPIIITRSGIIASSVVVANLTGLRTYIEGVDYIQSGFPDRIELDRVIGGAIADGETVLISYDIGPEPANQVDSIVANFTIRYTFERGWARGLALYMRFLNTDHSLSTDDPSLFVLDDVTSLLFGAEYRVGDFTFTAEREDRDSTVSPYDSTRLEARFDRRFGRKSTLTLAAYHELIEYTDENNELELLRFTGRWTTRLLSHLDLNLWVQYRDEHETVGGDTTGFEQSIELNWRYRQTSVFAGFRNAMLESDTVDRTSQTFTFGFRRTF